MRLHIFCDSNSVLNGQGPYEAACCCRHAVPDYIITGLELYFRKREGDLQMSRNRAESFSLGQVFSTTCQRKGQKWRESKYKVSEQIEVEEVEEGVTGGYDAGF